MQQWALKRMIVMTTLIGIVAGAWPCGIVVMLSELYGAESKAQVYGALHTFLQENQETTAALRTLLMVIVGYCNSECDYAYAYVYRFYLL